MNVLRPKSGARNGGAALIIALWTIALLSMLVMSFALDALLEGKINVYVKQRRHVDYLTQSGISIAEMLLLDYPNASPESSGPSAPAAAASRTAAGGAAGAAGRGGDKPDDKWVNYKLDLQRGACKVDHYPVDENDPEGGAVTVEISSADADRWPINLLVPGDKADLIWKNIFTVIGLPMEYQDEVVDSWYDWLDADSTVTGRNGAEDEYYDGLERKTQGSGKRLKMPRNGPVVSVDELKMIRGIREHPAIFDGGLLEPDKKSRFKKDKKDEVVISPGLKAFFDIYGENVTINVNSASRELLMTVPGIDGDEVLVGAILEERASGANRTASYDSGTESMLYKDWNDLNARIPGGVPSGAEGYLVYAPQKYFEVKVTGEAGGITHQIKAVAIVESDKVRYLRWREDP
jgi:hypothetical protein